MNRSQLFSKRSLAVSALVLSLTAGCGNRSPEVTKPPVPGAVVEPNAVTFPTDSPQLSTLRVVEAVPERESFVRINGRIAWDESRTSRVHVPLAGRVTEIHAAAGAQVGRGAVLAVVSSPDFGQAQAEARRAEAELNLADRALARARELHGGGVLPLKDLQLAETDHARARLEHSRTVARERLYGAGSGVDQLYRVTAPLAGVVVERRVNIGQEVRPEQGSDAPLFVVTDPTRLWVLLDVPESLSREVTVGEPIVITVPALPGEKFTARVEYVADFIDPATRMVRARAALANPGRSLKSEMYVTAEVSIPPSKALRVPAIGVFLLEDKHYAFVEESPGRFVRRQLRAEEATLGFMRVLGGIEVGEKVLADGALLLQQMLTQKASAPDRTARTGKSAE
ncbi:MAG: hypothetical protein RIS35_1286 [Pseudomonadota bacterium]